MLSALAGAARSPALHSGPLQRVGDETCGANASAVPMHRAYAPAAYTSARIAQRKATKRGPQALALGTGLKEYGDGFSTRTDGFVCLLAGESYFPHKVQPVQILRTEPCTGAI